MGARHAELVAPVGPPMDTTTRAGWPAPVSRVIDHRCARQDRCAHAETINLPSSCTCDCHLGPHYACSLEGGCGQLHRDVATMVGALIEEPYGLCATCGLVIADGIADLPHDYVSLRIAQYRGLSPVVGEIVSFSKDLPIPISLTFATLADQIEVTVTTFAEPVAEKLGMDWDRAVTPQLVSRFGAPPKYIGPVILGKSARLLSNAVDILLSLPSWEYRLWGMEGWDTAELDGISAALMLLDLHHATRATLGLTRSMTTMQAECPYCETQSLVKQAGKDLIQCQLCGRYFTEQDYQQWSIFVAGRAPKPKRRVRVGAVKSSTEGTVGRPIRQAE